MALTLKRETNFDKMLGDMISLPLDDEDKQAKDRALGRTTDTTSNKEDKQFSKKRWRNCQRFFYWLNLFACN